MDCNRDEATRAKEIAERKFSAKDIFGAKKFVLKAQRLYPCLEGLSQMLAIIDVHIAAENRMCGESDWYGMLGVTQDSDDEAVKKQYRKMALMLHPDKNKLVGAEGAFKLISQAWGLLSDKTKRVAYDNKRFPKPTQQSAPPASGGPSAPPGANGFNKSTNSSKAHMKPPKTSTHMGRTTGHAHSRPSPDSFWTACDTCQMQYEYLRKYLNFNLRCPHCDKPFKAVEMVTPPPNAYTSPVTFCAKCELAGYRESQARVRGGIDSKQKMECPTSREAPWV